MLKRSIVSALGARKWAQRALLALAAVAVVVSLMFAFGSFEKSDKGGARNGEIAFSVLFDTYQVFMIRPDGSGFRRVTNNLVEYGQPVASPDGRELAYTEGGEGHTDIFVAHADGSRPRRLTRTPGDDYDPAWSPDGKKLAFTSHRSGVDTTYVMNADGSGVRRVARRVGVYENPSWAPDGQRLVVSVNRAGSRPQLYVLALRGGTMTRLTSGRLGAEFPSWSPLGDEIAYTLVDRGDHGDIAAISLSTHRIRHLTSGPADDWEPNWSPDGRDVVFARLPPGGYGMMVIGSDGKGLRNLTSGLPVVDIPPPSGYDPSWSAAGVIFFAGWSPNTQIAVASADGARRRVLTNNWDAQDTSPTWSPDGSRIAFDRDRRGGATDIWVMNADGTNQRRLAADGAAPDWSPDGKRIAFARKLYAGQATRGAADIFVVNADGSRQVNLTRSADQDEGNPAWSPDGQRIAYSASYFDPSSDFDARARHISIINADGTSLVTLTSGLELDQDPTWVPGGTTLAFTRGLFTSDERIYIIDVGGKNAQRLRNEGQIEAEPAYSPDGARIAFTRIVKGYAAIYVADADGRNPKKLITVCDDRTAGNKSGDTRCWDTIPRPSWQPLG